MLYLVCLWRGGGLIADVALDSCDATISSFSIAETKDGAAFGRHNEYMSKKAIAVNSGLNQLPLVEQ